MKVNRRSFLQLAAGAAAAVSLGLKAKADPSRELTQDFIKSIAGNVSGNVLDSRDKIDVAGVPIYCDPYCPLNKIYFIRRGDPKTNYLYHLDLDAIQRWYKEANVKLSQIEERHLALISLVGAVKTHGELPTFGIVAVPRWVKMKQETGYKSLNYFL